MSFHTRSPRSDANTLRQHAAALDGEALLLRTAGDRDTAADANIRARAYRDLAEEIDRGNATVVRLTAIDSQPLAILTPHALSGRGLPLVYERENLPRQLVVAFLFACAVGGLILWAGANVFPVAGQ